jgi:hypothetical protein
MQSAWNGVETHTGSQPAVLTERCGPKLPCAAQAQFTLSPSRYKTALNLEQTITRLAPAVIIDIYILMHFPKLCSFPCCVLCSFEVAVIQDCTPFKYALFSKANLKMHFTPFNKWPTTNDIFPLYSTVTHGQVPYSVKVLTTKGDLKIDVKINSSRTEIPFHTGFFLGTSETLGNVH